MPFMSQTPANIAISSDSAVDKATLVCFLLTLCTKYHSFVAIFTQTISPLVEFLFASPAQSASACNYVY